MIVFILGIISRYHGGGTILPHIDKVWKNFLWTVPFFICAAIYLPIYLCPLTLLCLLKGTGHGRIYIPNTPLDLSKDPEKVEKIIGKLYGKIPDYWYKVLGMSLVGLASVLGGVIAFGAISPLAGLAVAFGGVLKGLNAMIFEDETAVREYADGATAGMGMLWAISLVS